MRASLMTIFNFLLQPMVARHQTTDHIIIVMVIINIVIIEESQLIQANEVV